MARRAAVIATSIWGEPSFRALRMRSQGLYFAIRTTPTLSKVGVTTELPDLWGMWTGLTRNEIGQALDDLAAHGRIVRDPETLELLAPDVFLHEHATRSGTHIERAIRDAAAIRSRGIQERVALLFEVDGHPRAVEAALALCTRSSVPARSGFISGVELRKLRREFLSCAARRRLRAEISAGVHVCAHCRAEERLTVDHIRPLARGGTNDLSNMQILCLACNVRKGVTV